MFYTDEISRTIEIDPNDKAAREMIDEIAAHAKQGKPVDFEGRKYFIRKYELLPGEPLWLFHYEMGYCGS